MNVLLGPIEIVSPRIFPDLKQTRWLHADLNALAQRDHPRMVGKSPYNDPEYCERAIVGLANDNGADYTYERPGVIRNHLWHGHYHSPAEMRHFGGDYNVPARTRVAAPFDCLNLYTYTDVSWGGWGGVVVLCGDSSLPLIILAHLDPALLPLPGTRFDQGATIGFIGTHSVNGGWYPHLHVQGLTAQAYAEHHENLFNNIDGYGRNDQNVPESMPDMHDTVFSSA